MIGNRVRRNKKPGRQKSTDWNSTVLTALLLLLLTSCAAPTGRIVAPTVGTTLYIVPEWPDGAARDELLVSLQSSQSVFLFLGEAGGGIPEERRTPLPEENGLINIGGTDIVYLVLPPGVTFLPLESLYYFHIGHSCRLCRDTGPRPSFAYHSEDRQNR